MYLITFFEWSWRKLVDVYRDVVADFLKSLSFFIFRYGFTNMRYIASLISGVGIFMMGAGLSWYHGIMGLLHPHPIESLLWVS